MCDNLYRKLVLERITLLLDCATQAVDSECVRADEAEMRLESVRETLATVRAQHEMIFNRYEDLKNSLASATASIPPASAQKAHVAFRPLHNLLGNRSVLVKTETPRSNGESVVKRMRAQLEESSRSKANIPPITPVAKRDKLKIKPFC